MKFGENVSGSAKIVKVELGEYCHVSCYLRDKLFQEYDLKKKYTENFLGMWNNIKESLLLIDDPFAANIYLDKSIDDGWLYQSTLMLAVNPVALITNYIETTDTHGYNIEDNLEEALKEKGVLSDAEIISIVSCNVSLKSRRDKITLLKINTDNFLATKEEHEALCRLVRNKYKILKVNPIALDEVVYEASMAFFRKFVPGKKLRGLRINEIAYKAESDWQFMKSMTMVLGNMQKPLKEKQILFQKDGYVATLHGTLEKPHVIISSLSFNMVLHGYSSFKLTTQFLFDLKGEEFWKEARHEFARKYEESLRFSKSLKKEAEKEFKLSSKCSDKYHMTLGEIQQVLKEQYDVEVTESAIGLTVKKALKKIEKNFENIGIDEKDYEMVSSL